MTIRKREQTLRYCCAGFQGIGLDFLAGVQVARGEVALNGVPLQVGDGARLASETRVVLDQGRNAEVLVFELA